MTFNNSIKKTSLSGAFPGPSHSVIAFCRNSCFTFLSLLFIASSFESALSQVGEIKDTTETYAAGRGRSKETIKIETEEAPVAGEEKTE